MRIIAYAMLAVIILATTACGAPTPSAKLNANGSVNAAAFRSLSACKQDPISAGRIIEITKPMTVNNLTIPADRALRAVPGGTITVATGKTLIIYGPVDFGRSIVFPGSGSVLFDNSVASDVNPEWWGARNNGSAADATINSAAFNAAAVAAAAARANIYIPPGTYDLVSWNIPDGVRRVYGPGTLRDTTGTASATDKAVVTLAGGLTGVTMDGIEVNVRINVTKNTTIYAITGPNVVNSTVSKSKIWWSVMPIDVNAIRFDYTDGVGATSNTSVADCEITFPVMPDYGAIATAVVFIGKSDSWGGYFTGGGITALPSLPCTNIVVVNNRITGGSHGVFMNGVVGYTIHGNVIKSTKHRGIIIEPQCWYGSITGNSVTDYGSSGILLAYGCQYNTVSGNTCQTTQATGEGGIQLLVGCRHNTVIGNTVSGPTWHGIYLAIGAEFNSVKGNKVNGYRKVAIGLASDWSGIFHTEFSRPNFAPPPVPYTSWAINNITQNTVQGNMIGAPNSAGDGVGIYLESIVGYDGVTSLGLSDNTIDGNVFTSTANMEFVLYAFEQNLDEIINNVLTNNSADLGATAAKIYLPKGRSYFRHTSGNTFLDMYYTQSGTYRVPFADGDTTPSVAIGYGFQTSNTAPTNITFFDGGIVGQEIMVVVDANTTVVHGGGIVLKGGVSATGGTSRMMSFLKTSTGWVEQWRNF